MHESGYTILHEATRYLNHMSRSIIQFIYFNYIVYSFTILLMVLCDLYQVYVEKVLMSYLHLLVNSRGELALARVMTGPHLDHDAFTCVRREAKRRNMPMYQVRKHHSQNSTI